MQNSSAFQYLAIDTIHESTTNPRRTFDEAKLQELAESIRQHGLIQPITVRPNTEGFEIVAGARRYRAAQLAELFSIPARIVEITDAQSLEWQLVENSQRVDVHPYEEAQGFQRLLDIPGYDVATLVEKSGKSASHIYARLSLLQLIPEVAEAFTQERITASHANLIARLPQESQAEAFEQCWRKDWQDTEPHLLPAKHVSAWIQTNLYLSLADAPFDREDPTLNPAAGACVTCPRRSGYNTSLFSDVTDGDQCLSRTLLSNQDHRPHRPRDCSPSRAYPDRERMEERTRAEARSRPARALPRDRDSSREPGRRASPAVRSRETRNHRLRQARRNHSHRMHRRRLPRTRPTSSRRTSRQSRPNDGTRARSRDRGRGRGTPAQLRTATKGVRAGAGAESRRAETAVRAGTEGAGSRTRPEREVA